MSQLLWSNDSWGLNIFDLPELLEQILYFLEIDRFLYPALFINHLWYHCSALILWYHVEFFNKDYRQIRRALNMSRVLTRRLINFERVMRGKIWSKTHYNVIKPLYCSKMSYLRLEGLKISDTFISAILHSCPNIRFLILDKSKGFSNIPIIEIARFSLKLQHLSLNSCICLTNRCITEIAYSCPKLRHFELGDCLISNKAVEEIVRNCTNLKYLSLEGCRGISEEVMKKLNPKIKIEYPDYSDNEFSDSDLPSLILDPLRVTRSVIFTDRQNRQNRLVLTNTLNVTDLISAIRISLELTDLERINLLNSLARAIEGKIPVKTLIDTTSKSNTNSKSLFDKLEEDYGIRDPAENLYGCVIGVSVENLYGDVIGEIKCLDLQFQYKGKWRSLDCTEVIDFQIRKNPSFDLVLGQDWL
ncbi:hypothetical protein Glove_117g526 [Diversispora epigaea]|uniref:F-box domain-containing protein n=1 Tax=Diversispora epigaea TaxID=1348612 RepID=A0A397JA28_9GLOM|nr:hypothetical protein Glove_117g526 [Diversispora epigaea]